MRRTSKLFAFPSHLRHRRGRLPLGEPRLRAEHGRRARGSQQVAGPGRGACNGLSALGGGIGQGRAAGSAVEGIARNPKASDRIFTPMILGLALIESLVIYGLVVAFLLYG